MRGLTPFTITFGVAIIAAALTAWSVARIIDGFWAVAFGIGAALLVATVVVAMGWLAGRLVNYRYRSSYDYRVR